MNENAKIEASARLFATAADEDFDVLDHLDDLRDALDDQAFAALCEKYDACHYHMQHLDICADDNESDCRHLR